MKNHNFDILLFDIGGVVIRQHDTSKIIRAKLGIEDEKFDELWWDAVKQFGSGQMSEDAFWQHLADNGAALYSSADNLFGATMRSTVEVFSNILDDISQLKKEGYAIAALSDTNEPHATVLRELHVYDQFEDNLFLSHEIGIRKPTREAYEYAMKQLGVQDPSRILFVDDRQSNLTSAQEVGMQVLLVPGSENENRAALRSIIASNTLL